MVRSTVCRSSVGRIWFRRTSRTEALPPSPRGRPPASRPAPPRDRPERRLGGPPPRPRPLPSPADPVVTQSHSPKSSPSLFCPWAGFRSARLDRTDREYGVTFPEITLETKGIGRYAVGVGGQRRPPLQRVLPRRPGAVAALALGAGDDGGRGGRHPGRRRVRDEPFRAPLADLDRPFGPPPGWWELLSWSRSWCCSCSSWPARCRWSCGTGGPTAPSASRSSGWRWPASACRSTRCCACSRSWSGASRCGSARPSASPPWSAIPVAAAIAMLRHDLYDVDKALALAVTWGLVTALLLAVYAAVSSVGGAAGRPRLRRPASAVGTAAAALLLLPALRVVRRAVDARIYPLRRAALAAVDDLHREVSAGPGPARAAAGRAARGAARPGAAGRLPGARAPTATSTPTARRCRPTACPCVLDGEQTGVLVPAPGPASPELLREVAGRCSTLVEVVRLRLGGGPGAARGRSPAGPGWSRSATRSAAGWSATCTTAPSSGWSRWACRCGWPSGTSTTAPSTSTGCSTRASPSSAPRSPSCARSPTGCGPAASTTGCRPRCRTWSAPCR